VIEDSPKQKKLVARVDKTPEKAAKPEKARGPGRLELAVAPWGEVLVDGKSRGLSPPLRVIEVAPGTHKVEIRNSTFPAHVSEIEVKPGEVVKIQHRFR
jgi:serine/threonine-protein kinase